MAFQCQFNVCWDAWGLLSACLYHFPSVLHLLFEVGPCLFYYLHLWHSSHHSVVIITVTVCSGLHSAQLLSAPLQRPVSGSCYCGFMSRGPIHAPAWLCNDPPTFSPSNNSDCVQSTAAKNLDCLLLQCQPMVGPAHIVLTFKNNRICNKRRPCPLRTVLVFPDCWKTWTGSSVFFLLLESFYCVERQAHMLFILIVEGSIRN